MLQIKIINMGILNRIFGKKEESSIDESIEETIEESTEEYEPQEGDLICSQCKMAIHEGQRVKTFNGKKMHMKPCWFKLRKTAKSFM